MPGYAGAGGSIGSAVEGGMGSAVGAASSYPTVDPSVAAQGQIPGFYESSNIGMDPNAIALERLLLMSRAKKQMEAYNPLLDVFVKMAMAQQQMSPQNAGMGHAAVLSQFAKLYGPGAIQNWDPSGGAGAQRLTLGPTWNPWGNPSGPQFPMTSTPGTQPVGSPLWNQFMAPHIAQQAAQGHYFGAPIQHQQQQAIIQEMQKRPDALHLDAGGIQPGGSIPLHQTPRR